MKTVDFNIKFREKIEKGDYKVTFRSKTRELPARIICWDRKGIVNDAGEDEPIVALFTIDDGSEILVEATANGHVWTRQDGSHQALYVTYQDLPSKLHRVKYSLAVGECPIDRIMNEIGYKRDDTRSYYDNKIMFINKYSKKLMNQLYLMMKKYKCWKYNDDEDWNLDFKPGDNVICKNDEGPWNLEVGKTYIIDLIGEDREMKIVHLKREKDSKASLRIGFYDFVDMFERVEEEEVKPVDNSKFDFTKLKAFTPVLARTGDHQTWFPHFFESYHPQNHGGEFYMIDEQHTLVRYSQCVPFEGNEKLLKTQDPIPPFYDIR